MASSSESVAPPNPPPSLEQEIRDLKWNLSAHRGFLLRLDGEGGRRFEMLEEDLIQLREEVVEALTHTTQQVNGRIAELESRVEKLELQAARSTLQNEAGVKAPLNEGPSNPEQQV
jgi:transposase